MPLPGPSIHFPYIPSWLLFLSWEMTLPPLSFAEVPELQALTLSFLQAVFALYVWCSEKEQITH